MHRSIMVTIRSTFLSLFILLLLHLSCSTLSPHHRRRSRNSSAAPKTSFFYFFKRLFSSSSSSPATSNLTPQPPTHRSHSSSTRSFRLNPAAPLLEHYPVSELAAEDESIVRIIFKTGWPEAAKTRPDIHRILKIHNSSNIISSFEEYRERVRSRAAAAKSAPRCVADGNELLRFHCTTVACDLDSGVCGRQYCSLCGIIGSGFSPKMDRISTLPTSYAAHVSVPEDIEAEFEFINVKRALMVCRVIAGRVGCDPGFDSLAVRGNGDEILVCNARAVLPCFVIVYTM